MSVHCIILLTLLNLCCLWSAEMPAAVAVDPVSNAATAPIVDNKLSDYRIYPGDLLVVSVFDHPDLSLEVRVPGDGRLAYPLIGDLANFPFRWRGPLDFGDHPFIPNGILKTFPSGHSHPFRDIFRFSIQE